MVAKNNPRSAHSLIEMLVVLIIVGVLIAIMVPAVQRSREAARMAQCILHQGQLAKAIHMHLADEPYGRFPGYRAFAADGTTVIGWAPQVFEYLGRHDLPEDPTQATHVELLVCPSNQGPQDTPRLNYVVNGGQLGSDSPADGIFFDHAKNERVYISKDDFRDGLTNTILLAENLDATQWNATDEASQCILWPLVEGSEINNGSGARPSSHHPGGFVAAFADGSVKFMSEVDLNEDPSVHTDGSLYTALLTPGGNDVGLGGDGGSEGSSDPGDFECDGELVAHWAFDDDLDFGLDSSDNNHDGTLFGGPTPLVMPGGGYALVYDDTDDKVEVPYAEDLNTLPLTVMLWCRVDAGETAGYYGYGGIITSRDPYLPDGVTLDAKGFTMYQAPDFRFYRNEFWSGMGGGESDGSGFDRLYSGVSFTFGEWKHVAYTLEVTSNDGSQDLIRKQIYEDGQFRSMAEDIPFVANPAHSTRIGCGTGSTDYGDFFFKGAIDDVRIYCGVLTATEIQQAMNEWPGP